MKKSEVLLLAAACPADWTVGQVADYCFTRLVAGEIKTPEQARTHWQIRQWVGGQA